MFGKSEWFRQDSASFAPAPATGSGRVYYGLWLAAIVIPSVLLVARGQLPEGAIWTALSASVFLFDLRRVRTDLRQQNAISRMHFIADEESRPVETEKFRLEIKR